MSNYSIKFFPEPYYDHLKIIRGVSFTCREIDVMACVLSGRGTKTMASFLSIALRTAETHLRNIMRKMECNSQEGIRDFVEKSDKFIAIKQHYISLLTEINFREHLQKISQQGNMEHLVYFQIPSQGQEEQSSFIERLRDHLTLAGIKIRPVGKNKKSASASQNKGPQKDDPTLCLLSEKTIAQLQDFQSEGRLEIDHLIQKAAARPSSVIVLLWNLDSVSVIPQAIKDIRYINFETEKSYYFSMFELLERILPSIKLGDIISAFKEKYDPVHDFVQRSASEEGLPLHKKYFFKKSYKKTLKTLLPKKQRNLFIGGAISLFSLSILLIMMSGNHNEDKTSQVNPKVLSIRSDLPIPTNAILLRRSNVLAQMEEKFRNQKGIRLVVLVGIGGAGKTTLARLYADQQHHGVVWEINAETKNSLTASFEALAYAISKTPEEKRELISIQEIKEASEREGKLLVFLKERIKLHSNWIFIYDNVDSFSDIKNFFPYDTNSWGNGKIIVTTRNNNIANNIYINTMNVISIGELSDAEKLALFDKIYNLENNPVISLQEYGQKINFLKDLPPFPLDITVAAYYLKDTKIPYGHYLDRLSLQSASFSTVQETLLRDIGQYNKTRYNIISLSLKRLIEKNQNYKDLLLLISLLDSQDIPKDLLISYKNESVVDSFIHDLKKNSFILDKELTYPKEISIFSIHRSTQQIFSFYLLEVLNLKSDISTFTLMDKILEKYLSEIINKGNFSKMRLIANHLEMFLSHKKLLNNLIAGSIGSYLGRIYFYLGNYDKSKDILERSLEKLKKTGVEDIKTAKVLVHLGDVNRSLSCYKDAQKYLEDGLEIFKKYYGENHSETAWAQVLLGNVYRELGKFKKAQEVIKKGLNTYRKDQDRYLNKVAWALIHLGDVHRSLGNYDQAKELYEGSVAIHKKIYGNDHIKTAWALVYLGIIYENIGNYEKAKDILLESIKIYEDNFGKNHIGTAWALVRLGIVYQHLYDHDNALNILNNSYEIHKKFYGDNHVRTAWVLVYLADAYRETGENEKASDILVKSLNIHQDYYGKNHIKIAWVLSFLANVYKNLGDYQKANNILTETLLAYEKHYGKNHIETAGILRDLGKVQLLQGQIREAELSFKNSVTIFHNNNHSESYVLLENLSDLYLKKFKFLLDKGEVEQSQIYERLAIDHLRKALKVAEAHFTNNSPYLKHIQNKLNMMLESLYSLQTAQN